jgi:hypothetical protein
MIEDSPIPVSRHKAETLRAVGGVVSSTVGPLRGTEGSNPPLSCSASPREPRGCSQEVAALHGLHRNCVSVPAIAVAGSTRRRSLLEAAEQTIHEDALPLGETGHSWPEASIVRQHWLSRLPGSARCRLGLGPGAPLGPRPSAAVIEGVRFRMDRGTEIIDRGSIFAAARHALGLWRWFAQPDESQSKAIGCAAAALRRASGRHRYSARHLASIPGSTAAASARPSAPRLPSTGRGGGGCGFRAPC